MRRKRKKEEEEGGREERKQGRKEKERKAINQSVSQLRFFFWKLITRTNLLTT